MTTKKSNDGEEKGKSSTRRKIAASTKKPGRASSAKSPKRTASAEKGSSIADERVPTSEELQADIAKRAYELYERRGLGHGQDLSDWLEAEQQIKKQKPT